MREYPIGSACWLAGAVVGASGGVGARGPLPPGDAPREGVRGRAPRGRLPVTLRTPPPVELLALRHFRWCLLADGANSAFRIGDQKTESASMRTETGGACAAHGRIANCYA